MQALNPLMLNFFLTFQICSLQWMPGCVLLNCGTCGTRMSYRKYVNVTLWTMFCWQTLDPALHVDVTTYLRTVAAKMV